MPDSDAGRRYTARPDDLQSAATPPDPTTGPADEPGLARGVGGLRPPEAEGELGRLGGYRVLELLGRGGMGAVFVAEDVALRRRVALKTILPDLAASPAARERFLREARAAAAVDHEHIVPIFGVGEDNNTPFLVMPLLRGGPLDQHLAGYPDGLPVPEAVRILREAASGLAAAHAAGLVHRDIKPANVWLEGDVRKVRILDFGLARPMERDAPLTKAGVYLGTPAYSAPEQAGGGKLDARADLFSLGVVAYQLLTGRQPFAAETAAGALIAVATVHPPGPAVLNPAVPADLSALVLEMLAKDKAARPTSADDVVKRLDAVRAGLDTVPLTPVPAWAARPAETTWGWRVGGVAGLAAAVAVGVFVLGRRDKPTDPPPAAGEQDPEVMAGHARSAALVVLREQPVLSLGWSLFTNPPKVRLQRADVGAAAAQGVKPPTTPAQTVPVPIIPGEIKARIEAAESEDRVVELVGLLGQTPVDELKIGPKFPLSAKSLAAIRSIALTRLVLSQVDGMTATAATLLGRLPVREIAFQHCRDARVPIFLLEVAENPTLLHLTFQGQCFGDDDFIHQLAGVKFLKTLAFDGADITDETVRQLAHFPKLERLVLTGSNRLTNQALADLAECRSLQRLVLDEPQARNPNFTPDKVKSLSVALPGCEIVWREGVLNPRSKHK